MQSHLIRGLCTYTEPGICCDSKDCSDEFLPAVRGITREALEASDKASCNSSGEMKRDENGVDELMMNLENVLIVYLSRLGEIKDKYIQSTVPRSQKNSAFICGPANRRLTDLMKGTHLVAAIIE
jgi:hypothetical protein